MAVGVAVGVTVAVAVGELVGVVVGLGDGVKVAVPVGVGVKLAVGVAVGRAWVGAAVSACSTGRQAAAPAAISRQSRSKGAIFKAFIILLLCQKPPGYEISSFSVSTIISPGSLAEPVGR